MMENILSIALSAFIAMQATFAMQQQSHPCDEGHYKNDYRLDEGYTASTWSDQYMHRSSRSQSPTPQEKLYQDFGDCIENAHKKDGLDKITALVGAGCDINGYYSRDMSLKTIRIKRANGDTALTFFAKYGPTHICEHLIRLGADVNLPNKKSGDSPLIIALKATHYRLCEHLIKSGANPNAKNKNHDTALLIAARKSKVDMCKILLEHGADTLVKNKAGNNAFLELFYSTRPGEFPYMCYELLKSGLKLNSIRNLVSGQEAFRYSFVDAGIIKDQYGEPIHEKFMSDTWFLKWMRPLKKNDLYRGKAGLYECLAICTSLITRQKELEDRMFTLLACLKHASSSDECAQLLYRYRKELLVPYLTCYTMKMLLNGEDYIGITAH